MLCNPIFMLTYAIPNGDVFIHTKGTDLPPYQCKNNSGNPCADNCTRSILGTTSNSQPPRPLQLLPPPPPPPHQQEGMQYQGRFHRTLEVPTGFAPWFPNNTRDADNIANNEWKQFGMSQMLTHGVNLGQAMPVKAPAKPTNIYLS